MRVEFLRPIANPTLNARVGQVVDLPDDQALQRIRAGHAVAVDQPRARLRDRLPGRRKQAGPKDSTPADKPLEERTVDQLKAYAAEHDIDLGDATKKAQILDAITSELARREADADDEDT
ncbi:hypothetical protein [Streptomyces sp. bgisy154]|uniref:hypothetical protein n=1 Tax=Streptomyces sp. bgisy154 TaxID=3413794 RepID=UPI003D73725C